LHSPQAAGHASGLNFWPF